MNIFSIKHELLMGATLSKKVKIKETTSIPFEDTNLKWIQRLKWILFSIAFLIYGNSISNGYNMDDYLVTKNHNLTSQGISAIGQIFSSPYYSDASGYSYGYRPIVHLSFAIEQDLFGENPQAGHFLSVLLFAFSVFFLFKFLNLLFGEDTYRYTAFACLLFAIHPVHTEVVDSLKNRDEILAFFFIILTAIQMIRYLDRRKITYFVLAFLFFVLAILSKKSIYPLFALLPVVIYLMKNVSWRKTILITGVLSIPASVFASEIQPKRMVILFFFPLLLLAVAYILKNVQTIAEKYAFKNYRWLLPLVCSALILYYTAVQWKIEYALFTFPFFFWLFKIHYKIGLWTFVAMGAFLAFRFELNELYTANLFLATLLFSYQAFIKKRVNIPSIALLGTWVILTAIIYQRMGVYLFLLNFMFFLWLLAKKRKIGVVIYSIVVCTVVLLIRFLRGKELLLTDTNLLYVGIIVFSVILLLFLDFKFEKKLIVGEMFLILGVIVSSLAVSNFIATEKNLSTVTISPTATKVIEPDPIVLAHKTKRTTPNYGKNIFQEGRDLEYVENPLVAKHSASESIATGFYTLGQYLRLLVYPKELSYYYGYSKIDVQRINSVWVWVFIAFYVGMVFLLLFYYRKNWLITVGFSWYLACIFLFSNWIELVAGVVGERLVYLASAGFFIGVAGILQELKLFERKKELYISVVCTVCFPLMGRTWVRNKDWKDDYTLMKHDIQHLQNSAQANNLYASVLMRMGTETSGLTQEQQLLFFKAGTAHFKRATEIDPLFFNAIYDWGRTSMYIADTANAIIAFERCTRLSPDFDDPKQKLSYLKFYYSKYQGHDKRDYEETWGKMQKKK